MILLSFSFYHIIRVLTKKKMRSSPFTEGYIRNASPKGGPQEMVKRGIRKWKKI